MTGAATNGPLILGVNCVYHESSACLLDGSNVLAMVEEERLTRVKRAKRARVDNADEVPRRAIRYCLEAAGVGPERIDLVALSYDPALRRPPAEEPAIPGDWGSEEGERRFLEGVRAIPERLSEELGRDVGGIFHWVPHHLAHAASAYFASPFDEAAVLSVDGIGESATTLLAHGRGTELVPIGEIHYPNSLGLLWERCSSFVGLGSYDAAKLMALAGFGDPGVFARELDELVRITDGGFEVDGSYARFRADGDRLAELFGRPTPPEGEVGPRDAHLAAALQATTERVLVRLARRLREETGATLLCLAGGVALNCVANDAIALEAGFDELFVQPAANDAGTALGAALHAAHALAGVESRWVMSHPYLGPSFGEAEVEAALAEAGLAAVRVERPEAEAARRIAAGEIVGWFQGATEIGPRALGNRSILADPRRAGSKELVNLLVKHREFFRPFAPSVLAEHAADWFRLPTDSISLGFMSFACRVRPEKASLVPAIVHVDGTSRIQVVSRELNERYHALIDEFRALTGVPLVLNTSFNGPAEPIVNAPADALRTFGESGMDAVFLGDLLVERKERRPARGQS